MRLAIAQIGPVVGAFGANVRLILESYSRACAEKADLLLTPELSVCGYPPHDLIERPEMLERNERALADLKLATRGQKCALVVGHVARNPEAVGRASVNRVSILADGREVFHQDKTLLPTYDVFDEARYFEPARSTALWESPSGPVGVAICEDLWARDSVPQGRVLYGRDPVDTFRATRPKLLLSLSASPYEWGKRERREELHRGIARELGVPFVYVNQVGSTDEILFDGASFAADAQGRLVGRLPAFRPSFAIVEVDVAGGGAGFASPDPAGREDSAPPEIQALHRGLVSGIAEFFERNRMKTAILGLSGGIDSAVVAALAAEALGPRNVMGIAMPSRHSSGHSLEDAEALARNLGMPFEVRPIKFLCSTIERELSERRGELAPVAVENLQARLRGMILMTLSNHYGALVLTTGNKSELAMGYCTLYGDMCGALAPIGDLFKTRVYELAREINRVSGGPIPERCLTKAPSAELRPNQTDQDTLPPYEVLDPLLAEYLEARLPVSELVARHEQVAGAPGAGWVTKTLEALEQSEFKRRQAAPVLKASPKAFGLGRRIPLSRSWSQQG